MVVDEMVEQAVEQVVEEVVECWSAYSKCVGLIGTTSAVALVEVPRANAHL